MTMVADNVEVEADNITPEVEETPTDVVVEAEPETPAEAEVSTPSIAELIKGLSEDEIAALPEVNGILQRRTQSARDKAAAETTTKLFAQQQEFVTSGNAERELLRIAEAAADNLDERGHAKADATEVKKVATALLSHGVSVAVSQLFDAVAAEVKDGFKLTQAETDFINSASLAYKQNPLDASLLQRAWMAPLKRAWAEEEREAGRAEGRAEAKREQEAAEKAAKAAAAATARSETPKPTPVNGIPISTGVTLAQWAAATYEQRQEWKKQGVEPVIS